MQRSKLFWSIPLLASGCTGKGDAERPEACSGTSESAVALLTELEFGRENEDGSAPGFDLDQAESSMGGTTGCGRPDHMSPDGIAGIDNAFSRIVPLLEQTEAVAVESIVRDHIESGVLLLLVELNDLDDPLNDDCVDFTMGRGQGDMLLAADSEIVPHQTFQRDDSLPSSSVLAAPLIDGSLQADPIEFSMPISIFGANIDLTLTEGATQIELYEDGSITGMVAGGVDIYSIIDITLENPVNDEVRELLDTMLHASADLDPDGDGVCDHISATLEFSGTPAFIYE